MRRRAHALPVAALVLAACAQQPPQAPPAATATAAARPPAPEFPLRPPPPYVTPETPQGSGPYPALMEQDPRLPTHTLYRPARLEALAAEKLPIVAWGNGACVNQGNRFRYFLTEIASHGFLALAIGPMGGRDSEIATSGSAVVAPPAPGSPAAIAMAALPPGTPLKPGPSGLLPSRTMATQLTDAIDWAIAENARPGSRFFGRLDTTKIAVMGQSCGGLQALAAAKDPRVTTVGVWNSGLFSNDLRAWDIAAARVVKADLKTLHGSAIYITGEPSDVAFENAQDDFRRIDGIPVFHAWREKTGHGGTYREPDGGAFGEVGVAWLRWQLKGDAKAARMFTGPDCGLCKRPEWHVQKKRID